MTRRTYNGTRFSVGDTVWRRIFHMDSNETWRGDVVKVIQRGRLLDVEWSHAPGVKTRCHASTVSSVNPLRGSA